MGELVGRTEHADSLNTVVPLARVVVDEADRGHSKLSVALHLPHDQLARVTRSHDKHFAAARNNAGARTLDQRTRQQSRTGDECEQQQVVERRNTSRKPLVRGRKGIEHEIGKQRCHGDAARGAPHVACRDVPPPAVVEAEDNEHRELDGDDDRKHLPREQVPVVDRGCFVETKKVGETPRCGDQRGVEEQLPDAPPVDRQNPHAWTSDDARRRTPTTSACCSSVMPAQSGRQRFSRDAFSVSGNSPAACPR